MNEVTAGAIGTVVGVTLSLIALLVPKVNVWFAAQKEDTKKAIMAWAGLAVCVAAGALSCFNIYPLVTCDVNGGLGLLAAFLGYAIGNQSVYRMIPEPKAVKLTKLNRPV